MNQLAATIKNRVLRSDFELDQQNNILWMSALFAIVAIHSGTLAVEGYMLAVNALILLGIPLITLGVMKLIQPAGFAYMRRSKRIEFVDDIRNSSLEKERLPAFEIHRAGNSRATRVSRKVGSLALMLLLYVVVVLLSFAYQSPVYFYIALAISVCLVAGAIFALVAMKVSRKQRDIVAETPSAVNEEKTLNAGVEDTHISWGVNSTTNTQVRFSRSWLTVNALYLGMWVPLALAVPLLGPLFGGMFWIATGLGAIYLFVLEMCSIFSFTYAASRFLQSA